LLPLCFICAFLRISAASYFSITVNQCAQRSSAVRFFRSRRCRAMTAMAAILPLCHVEPEPRRQSRLGVETSRGCWLYPCSIREFTRNNRRFVIPPAKAAISRALQDRPNSKRRRRDIVIAPSVPEARFSKKNRPEGLGRGKLTKRLKPHAVGGAQAEPKHRREKSRQPKAGNTSNPHRDRQRPVWNV
jgi:hypothetical protein